MVATGNHRFLPYHISLVIHELRAAIVADTIVAERERNGPFRSPDDLTRVHGIGEGRLAQLRDFVTV